VSPDRVLGRELGFWWRTSWEIRVFSLLIVLLALVGTGWGIAADAHWDSVKFLVALSFGGVIVVELGYVATAGGPVPGRVQWGLSAWPFAAALLVAPFLAGLVTAPIFLCERYRGRDTAVWEWVTSGAVVTISAWAAGSLFNYVAGSSLQAEGSAMQLGAVASAVPTYLVAEVLLLAVATRLYASTLGVRLSTGDFYLSELAVVATGASVAVVCRYGVGFLSLMIPMVVVLQRAWLYVPYRQGALQDPKTRLLNYQAWRHAARIAAQRELAGGQGWAVVFIDLDHFKAVNDDYGHTVGDEVLIRVADALREVIRAPDLVGRYGGEEFCVLLPGADVHQATEVAERLRAAVAALRFSREKLKVTASFGVAVQTSDDRSNSPENIDNLVRRADRALYAAKDAGRDRVRVWGQRGTGP